jgi:hypothetical protein
VASCRYDQNVTPFLLGIRAIEVCGLVAGRHTHPGHLSERIASDTFGAIDEQDAIASFEDASTAQALEVRAASIHGFGYSDLQLLAASLFRERQLNLGLDAAQVRSLELVGHEDRAALPRPFSDPRHREDL